MARRFFRRRSNKSKEESDNTMDPDTPVKKSSIFKKKPKAKTSTETATTSHHKRVNKKHSLPIDSQVGSTTSTVSDTIKKPKKTETTTKKPAKELKKVPNRTTILKKPVTIDKDLSKLLPSSERPIALAIVTKIKNEAQIAKFIDFGLETLKKHSMRLNKLALAYKLNKFCLIVGDGPRMYRVHRVLHPCTENDCNEKLTIELNDNEDLDVFGFAAVLKLNNDTILNLLNYLSREFALSDDEFKHEYIEARKLGAQVKVLKEVNSKFSVLYKYEIEITAAINAQVAAKISLQDKKTRLMKRLKH